MNECVAQFVAVWVLWIQDLNKEGTWEVHNGTASGVVKARTIKRLPSCGRRTDSFLDEALGSELTHHALEDDGRRVGIRALVLQLHAGVPLPPLAPEVRQVRRAPLRRTDFEQFGYGHLPWMRQRKRRVVNKRWIIQNSAVPAWKQSW